MKSRSLAWMVFALAYTASVVVVAQTESNRDLAKSAVDSALKLEAANSSESERAAKLELALGYDKNYAPAHWHRGELFSNGKWLSLEESAQKNASHPYLRAYEKKRRESRDTEEGNWEVANWCASRSLWSQRYAHLCRVLELNPHNDAAKVSLGWRQSGRGWISSEQLIADVRTAQEEWRSLQTYGKKVDAIAAKLTSPNEKLVEVGMSKLKYLVDPAAVVAIERKLSSKSEAIGLLAVQVLEKIRHPSATRSLMRHSVFHPSQKVREQAGDSLLDRDPQGWAPMVLSLLKDPISVEIQTQISDLGELMGVRHVFQQEGMDKNNLLVVDSRYEHLVLWFAAFIREAQPHEGDTYGYVPYEVNVFNQLYNMKRVMEQEELVRRHAAMQSAISQKAAAEQNMVTEQINDRVFQVVDKLAGKKVGASPDEYWQWWYSNKYWTYSREYKPKTVAYRSDISVDARFATYTPKYYPATCLAKGTQVWTASGMKSVEEVRIGDQVFSIDIASGMIQLSPVTRTTIRPDAELLALKVTGDELQCSKGHEFFVSGKGWTKACDLRTGDYLHTASGSLKIESIEQQNPAPVYNIVVANDSNYFVGPTKILSHDFSERSENYYMVPGLELETNPPKPR